MTMRTKAEKKMRKFLKEQIKARQILGARIAQGGDKTPIELLKLNCGPQVFMFKNLFTGQVLYSQVPAYHQDQIDLQFPNPNWQNRKPARRNDLWRIMCVATFANHKYAVAAYKGLVQLRHARDIVQRDEARAMRKNNEDGNIWYSGQFRPTYAQEAVADLAHVIDEFGLEETKVYWENEWRRGEDKYWNTEYVKHDTLPVFNPRDQTVMLDILREKSMKEFAKLRARVLAKEARAAAAAASSAEAKVDAPAEATTAEAAPAN